MDSKLVGKKLVIEIPTQKPKLSASRKTLVIATTRGAWESAIEIDGKPVKILLNAYIDADAVTKDEDNEEDEPKTKRRK